MKFEYHLHDYHPYHNGNNPSFNDKSQQILSLKDRNLDAIEFYTKWICQLVDEDESFMRLESDDLICVVPSHNPSSQDSGIRDVAKKIYRQIGVTNGLSCLYRSHMVNKLSRGGNRSYDIHYNSVKVRGFSIVQDRQILLLDDVTTTWNSMHACADKLLDAGAERVFMLACALLPSRFLPIAPKG